MRRLTSSTAKPGSQKRGSQSLLTSSPTIPRFPLVGGDVRRLSSPPAKPGSQSLLTSSPTIPRFLLVGGEVTRLLFFPAKGEPPDVVSYDSTIPPGRRRREEALTFTFDPAAAKHGCRTRVPGASHGSPRTCPRTHPPTDASSDIRGQHNQCMAIRLAPSPDRHAPDSTDHTSLST